jgi:hypothetical protein
LGCPGKDLKPVVVGREQLDPSASGGIAVAEAPVKVTGGVALTNTGDSRDSGTPRPGGVPDPGGGDFNLREASIRSKKAIFKERLSGRKNKRCLHFRRQLTDLRFKVIFDAMYEREERYFNSNCYNSILS